MSIKKIELTCIILALLLTGCSSVNNTSKTASSSSQSTASTKSKEIYIHDRFVKLYITYQFERGTLTDNYYSIVEDKVTKLLYLTSKFGYDMCPFNDAKGKQYTYQEFLVEYVSSKK